MNAQTAIKADEFLAPDRYERAVAHALSVAKAEGATSAEAGVSAATGLSVTVRLGELETIEHHRDKELVVTVYRGQQKGSSVTSDTSPAAIAASVKAACNIARHTSADEYAGLADPENLAGEVPDLELDFPWDLTVEEAIDVARHCEQAGRDTDPRINNSDGSTVTTQRSQYVYGNSHGFVGSYATTRHGISCTLIAADDTGMQRDYWYTTTRDNNDLEPAAKVGVKAAHRTVDRLGARRIKTCQTPVIFAAEVAKTLLGHLVSAVQGPSLYRKASFLLDRLGQQIFPEFVHIYEQPFLKKALGSAPFDGEGVATQQRDLVHGGRLEGYVLDSYAARKLGLKTTGNAGGIHNLSIDPQVDNLEALLKMMSSGLLVTELMGMGVNIVTGDYSRGASGYWVEDGCIQYPVEEITVAGNLAEIFRQLVAVGGDIDMRGNIRSGSLLIESMTVAGD
jgi:PmbA protein